MPNVYRACYRAAYPAAHPVDVDSGVGPAITSSDYDIPTQKSGDTWDGFRFQFLREGAPVDLTGAKIKMQVKRRRLDRRALIDLNSDASGIEIAAGSDGYLTINERVADIPPGRYVYDIQITLADGDIITPVGGTWTIADDTTR